MKKITVVWLCVTPFAPLNHIMKLEKVPQVLAPWITATIDELKKRENIKLNVISVGPGCRKSYSFNNGGINYYFIRRFSPSIMKLLKMQLSLDRYLNALHLKWKVKRLVQKINPDIINLHGTEHEICATFPQLSGNKILTIQGFLNLVYKERPDKKLKKQLSIENKIFRTTDDFIIQARFMPEIIKKFKPDARFHFCQYPSIQPLIEATDFKKGANIIFAGRICREKGIEDLLNAVIIVREKKPGIKVKIVGRISSDEYEFYLKKLIMESGIERNIDFIGFVPSYDELYLHIAKSEILVLPTHHDVIPSSVIESMFIGTPVISTCVGGLPDLNLEKQTCILVEKKDVNGLAEIIINLLNDKKKQKELVENAREMVFRDFNVKTIADRLIEIYITKLAQKTN
jgi:glycosyltransferase involved in cell wall biosynthesis